MSVANVSPYTEADSDALFVMLNKDLGHPTGKQIIAEAINSLYDLTLNASVQSHS